VRDTEDEIIVPILDDVLAAERRLLLKAELRIRKHRTDAPQQ
jgi:hypothetical protein